MRVAAVVALTSSGCRAVEPTVVYILPNNVTLRSFDILLPFSASGITELGNMQIKLYPAISTSSD